MDSSTTWLAGVKQQNFPSLDKNIRTDILVVGGGIAGVLTAYLLAKNGKEVVLVEKNKIGEGTTAYTTAFITYVVDARLRDYLVTFGQNKAKQIWQSHKEAIDLLEQIVKEENIDCEFVRCNAYYYAHNKIEFGDLKKEKQIGSGFGFDLTIKKENTLSFKNFGSLQIPNQAKFHPVKFVKGLAKAAKKLGVTIYENTEVLGIDDKSPIKAKTKNGNVLADYVVLDTYNPLEPPTLEFQAKLIGYQSYVIEAHTNESGFEEALYWDTEDPYYYLRVDKLQSGTRLVLGGLDHPTGKKGPKYPYLRLEEYLRKVLKFSNFKVARKWTSQVLETTDGIAVIGEALARKNQFFATGFSGNGMTYAPISAQIITDAICRRKSKYQPLYNPHRFNKVENIFMQQVNYVKEMASAYFFSDFDKDVGQIRKDSGKVLVVEGKKVAIYKSPAGKLTKLSPVCTHLKCIVAWNDAGKSWDCPCHGSRYTKEGEVLNGPAKLPLSKL